MEKKEQKKITKKALKRNAIKIRGIVTHRVNGKIVKVKENAIHADLYGYMQSSLNSVIDKAINSLMDTAEVAPGGAQDGNDGIAFFDNTASGWLTFVTTSITASNTYGVRWKGAVTVSQAREVTQLAIGHSYENSTPPFDTVFSTQSFSGINLQSGANYEVEWELYLDNS